MSRINPTPGQRKFDEARLLQVIVAPIISEKATRIFESGNATAFHVLRDASKLEIKAAVEMLFDVKVSSVQVVNVKGKTKRFGRSIGRRNHMRKAYVRVADEQSLNLSGEVA